MKTNKSEIEKSNLQLNFIYFHTIMFWSLFLYNSYVKITTKVCKISDF